MCVSTLTTGRRRPPPPRKAAALQQHTHTHTHRHRLNYYATHPFAMATAAVRCLYAVLGVERDADDGAIKVAYRKAALTWHPGPRRARLL